MLRFLGVAGSHLSCAWIAVALRSCTSASEAKQPHHDATTLSRTLCAGGLAIATDMVADAKCHCPRKTPGKEVAQRIHGHLTIWIGAENMSVSRTTSSALACPPQFGVLSSDADQALQNHNNHS